MLERWKEVIMANNKLDLESLGKSSNNYYTEYIVAIIYYCYKASIDCNYFTIVTKVILSPTAVTHLAGIM